MGQRVYNILFNLHTVSGIVISVALYVIFFAGSFSFFRDEIVAWERNEQALNEDNLPQDIDQILTHLDEKYVLEGRDVNLKTYYAERAIAVNLSASKDSLAPEKAKQAVQFVFPGYGQKTPLPPEGGDSGGDVSGTDTSGSQSFAYNPAESDDTTSDTTGGSDSIDGSGTSDSGTVTSDGSDTGSSSSSPPGSSSNKGKKSFTDRLGDFFWGKDKDSDSASKSISPGAVFAKDMSGATDTPPTDTGVSTEEKPKGFMRGLTGVGDFITGNAFDLDKRGDGGDDDKVSGTQTKDSSSIEGVNKKSDGKVAEQISKDDGEMSFAMNPSQQSSEGTGQNVAEGALPPEGTKGSVPLPIISSSNSRNNYVYTSLKHYQITSGN